MQVSQWFSQQLRTSTEGFLWAVDLIPQERCTLSPRLDRWSVARIVYHMRCYDRFIGLPALRQWLNEPFTLGGGLTGDMKEDAAIEAASWHRGEGHDLEAMIAEFKQLRDTQIALLQHFQESVWSEERAALWGIVSLRWAVTKTYQHTLEHTNEILNMYLWWK